MNRGVRRMWCVAKFCLHPSSSVGCAGIACSVETRKLPHWSECRPVLGLQV